MIDRKKSNWFGVAVAIVIVVAAICVAVTCATRTVRPPSVSEKISTEPAATPLPAIPVGEMATPPSAGEPPVGYFTEEQMDQFDKLPVGSGEPAAEAPAKN